MTESFIAVGDLEEEEGYVPNSRAIIDACRPFHRKDGFPLVNAPLPELAKEARETWGCHCNGLGVVRAPIIA